MSETEAAVATAPTEAQEGTSTPAPIQDGAAAAPIEGPRRPLSRQEAQRAAIQKVTQRTEAAPAAPEASAEAPATVEAKPDLVIDERGRKHDPATGKFVPETGTEPTAAEGPQGDGAADAPPAEEPSVVRIELPEGHSLREQGLEFIDALPGQERAVRALLNSDTRRSVVERVQDDLRQVREENTRLRAEQETRQKILNDPQFRVQREKIEAVREVDPELAALMEFGLEKQVKEQSDGRYQELAAEQAQAERAQYAQRFHHENWQQAQGRYPSFFVQSPAFQAAFQQAAYQYGAEIDFAEKAGQQVQPDPSRFFQYLDQQALQNPQVREHLKGELSKQEAAKLEAERARIAAEKEAEHQAAEKARLTDAGRRHSTRGDLIPGAVRTDRNSISTEEPSLKDVPLHQRRKVARERAVQRFSGRTS